MQVHRCQMVEHFRVLLVWWCCIFAHSEKVIGCAGRWDPSFDRENNLSGSREIDGHSQVVVCFTTMHHEWGFLATICLHIFLDVQNLGPQRHLFQ